MSDEIIVVDGLHKYFGHVQAVKGVNLRVGRGEVVLIVGPSGSGKSTVLRCINHLEVPTSGSVYIDGVHLEDKRPISMMCEQKWAWCFSSLTCFRT